MIISSATAHNGPTRARMIHQERVHEQNSRICSSLRSQGIKSRSKMRCSALGLASTPLEGPLTSKQAEGRPTRRGPRISMTFRRRSTHRPRNNTSIPLALGTYLRTGTTSSRLMRTKRRPKAATSSSSMNQTSSTPTTTFSTIRIATTSKRSRTKATDSESAKACSISSRCQRRSKRS